jgi:TMEM175 potassium channel family protein
MRGRLATERTLTQIGQAPVNETARVEAFSDGVFAIAITLLVLELKVPHADDHPGDLYRALIDQWPTYIAFLTSFATIGIMWLNHHRLFTLIQRSTHTLILLNMLLLLGVTVVPFPTAAVADNLRNPANERTAALLYNGWFVCIALVFNVLWRYASAGGRLLAADVDQAAVDAQTRQYLFGPVFYVLAWAVAWVSATLSIGINLALALFFAIPPRTRKTIAR